MTRDDLRALDAHKLAALTSVGLVKRAERELARGLVPTLTVEPEGSLTARLGEIATNLPFGRPISAAECSCSARGICRHVLIAVLAYIDAEGPARTRAWSPGAIDDGAIWRALGPAARRRARNAREAGFAALVTRDPQAPTAELDTCTVRFLVPMDLGYARCDCRATRLCAHVALAVWAHRRADSIDGQAPRLRVEVGARAMTDVDALDEVLALSGELLRAGTEGSGALLAPRFARAREPLVAGRMRWPLDVCDALERTLASYASRGAGYRPERVAASITELHARARAAAAGGAIPSAAVLGRGEPDETRQGEVRLVSLGARVRIGELAVKDRVSAQAEVYLADPDAGHVLVLRKRWTVSPDSLGPRLGRRAVARGVSLGTLARGQMVTRAATRLPNRELRLTKASRAETSVTPQLGEWSALGDTICPVSVRDLRAQLAALPPALVRPRVLAESVRVVPVVAVKRVGYRDAEQTLWAELVNPSGESITLELEHDPGRAHAIDAAMEALRAGPRFVSGLVRWTRGGLTLDPIAIVTDRVIVLDLEPASPTSLPRGGRATRVDPLGEALGEAREALDDAAHQGLLHLSASWHERAAAASRRLEDVGLARCAAHLNALRGSEASEEAWVEASIRIRLALTLAAQVGSNERS